MSEPLINVDVELLQVGAEIGRDREVEAVHQLVDDRLCLTDEDPFTILSGGPTQTHIDPTVAAGKPPIRTVGTP